MGKEFGMLPNRLKPAFTTTTSMFKGLGLSTEEAMGQAEIAVTAAADAAAFYDKSYEEANSALNSFIKGNYEGGESIGLFANETQMAAWAAENLGVDWQELDEAGKQVARLEFATVMQEAAGATGQASRESEGYENQVGNMKQAWEDFKAIVGQPILGVAIQGLQTVTGWLQTAGEKVQEFTTWVKENETIVMLLGVVLGTLTTLLIAYKIQQALATAGTTLWGAVAGAATAVTTALGTAFAFLTSPIGLIIIAIGALIAIGILLYKNWDTVKAKAIEIWTAVKEFFSQTWESIKTTASALWNSIKSYFINLWNSLKASVTSIFTSVKNFFSTIWNGIKSIFKTVITAIVNTAKTWFNNFKNNVTSIFNAIKNFISTVWNGIKIIFINVVQAIVNLVTGNFQGLKQNISNIFNAIKSVASSVWNGIKSTISNVVNRIKNSVINTFNSVKSRVSNIWNSIKSAITRPINSARDAVKRAIDKIKSIMNFKWSLPKLKLPRISISGGFSLVPPKVPKFSIRWNADGAIFDKPTIFDTPYGMQGVGEAGPEAVLPINKLPQLLGLDNNNRMVELLEELVAKFDSVAMIIELLQAILAKDFGIYIDGKELYNRLSPHIATAVTGRR